MENKTKREKYLDKGYSEKEVNFILELEAYAEKMDDCIDRSDKMDLSELFVLRDNVQNDNDLEPEILSYAEYLIGAGLPLHLDIFKQGDYVESPELNEILNCTSWVNLIDRLEEKKIDLTEFENRMSENIGGKFKEYYDKSKYKWALLYGFHHYWLIKNDRDSIKSFE